ncbi:MAG: hydrogenase maturation nickel metallochaperone HypA [Deltaproteobacteria bacterium]|nr:MAG: hydrogenase maturation nickel metallochaperone HypA [Deltaproteobacteria bacterium]
MHESSLGRNILEAVLGRVGAESVKVRTVRGWLAESEALDPVAIQMHFDRAAAGTAAEGARLDLAITHVRARCADCGQEYLPEHHLTLCTHCGSLDGELLGKTGLGIDAIDVEDV